jgi:hypothetical protein
LSAHCQAPNTLLWWITSNPSVIDKGRVADKPPDKATSFL